MALPTLSGTLVGGIQDISALLPLLGTEQCETHVGSALDRGFLYSSITPISIFGSLGIVRAAFNILIASFNIQRYRFLGAKKLNDGGFYPAGVVAPMIALDPRHPKRFLAESRLEAMLDDEHIENVEDLTVSLGHGQGVLRWNVMLVSFSLVIATAGLLPYILIIHNSQHSRPMDPDRFSIFPSGWGFPVARVLGSAFCVIAAQFLMQIRISVLLKMRLLFVTIDRLAKKAGIDLESIIQTGSELNSAHEQKQYWNVDVASETCIWTLQKWLATEDRQNQAHAPADLESQAHATKDRKSQDHATGNLEGQPHDTGGRESQVHRPIIQKIYTTEYERQLDSMNKFVPLWITPILGFTLVIGIALTVGGYIGCFYLIQHSTNDTFGPVVWLVLEALLSIIRILVWALNPSWDDSEGIIFKLQLATHPPLITCNISLEEITEGGLAPVARANNFLEDIVTYTGPLPSFDVNDVALYYIFTAADEPQFISSDASQTPSLEDGVLCVIISAYQEQESRILFKRNMGSSFFVYISTLERVPGSTVVNFRVDLQEGATEFETHFLTADARFMDQLTSQYDAILSQLQNRKSSKATFGKTWDMQRPSEKKVGMMEASVEREVVESRIILTKEDMTYLRHGQMERRRRYMCLQLEEWIELYIGLFTEELFQDVPVIPVFEDSESLMSVAQKYEANKAEYLLIECWTSMEWFLMDTATKWDEHVQAHHENMVDSVVTGTFAGATGEPDRSEQHSERIRKGKLTARLAGERESLIDKTWSLHMENMHQRLRKQANLTQRRICERRYYDLTGEAISAEWLKILTRTGDILECKPWSSWTPRLPLSARRALLTDEMRSNATALRGKSKVTIFEALQMALRTQEFGKIESKILQNDLHEFELIVGRCRERADRVSTSMNYQRTDIKELQNDRVLTGNADNLLMYWSTESLQERRRLLDKNQKYLYLSDTSIKAVGGPQNMIRALLRSQDFTFLDVRESTKLTVEDILLVLKGVKSIRGFSSNLGETAEKEILNVVQSNVCEAVAAKQDTCLYENVFVTDYRRKGRPYLLFKVTGSSRCTVTFHTRKKRDHIIRLRHCMTTINGKVDIKLNSQSLERTWGTSQAVKLNFADEDVELPAAYLNVEKPVELTISLAEGVYGLSDVFLPIRMVQVHASGDGPADP
ncbi:hypothetical protein HYPSUDRAFT_39336 [Hypholoma sublateritium FD-334 SS-4]|uniref:Uncharacterized protein n=1 Tax=Hypholoma sublateritium (strain FD-334 SS-4) TaxID=945553 RepID=A0A0D2MJH6_HYPSF|nr:hypothetical protein HYPSUDRAFT_39336 [Hypholoma sublateritium FD-334 SS-4]